MHDLGTNVGPLLVSAPVHMLRGVAIEVTTGQHTGTCGECGEWWQCRAKDVAVHLSLSEVRDLIGALMREVTS